MDEIIFIPPCGAACKSERKFRKNANDKLKFIIIIIKIRQSYEGGGKPTLPKPSNL